MPDRPLLIAASRDGSLRFWDTNKKECIETIEKAHRCDVRCVRENKRAGVFATCGDDAHVKVWDAKDFRLLSATKVPGINFVFKVEWLNNDTDGFLTCDSGGHVRLWEPSCKTVFYEDD